MSLDFLINSIRRLSLSDMEQVNILFIYFDISIFNILSWNMVEEESWDSSLILLLSS